MRVLLEEYGMFIISCLAFVTLASMMTVFTREFASVSKHFIADMTGVSGEYSDFANDFEYHP